MHINLDAGRKLCIKTKCIESVFYAPAYFINEKWQEVVEIRMCSGQKDIIHIKGKDVTYLFYQELVEKLELNNR